MQSIQATAWTDVLAGTLGWVEGALLVQGLGSSYTTRENESSNWPPHRHIPCSLKSIHVLHRDEQFKQRIKTVLNEPGNSQSSISVPKMKARKWKTNGTSNGTSNSKTKSKLKHFRCSKWQIVVWGGLFVYFYNFGHINGRKDIYSWHVTARIYPMKTPSV